MLWSATDGAVRKPITKLKRDSTSLPPVDSLELAAAAATAALFSMGSGTNDSRNNADDGGCKNTPV